MNAWSNDSKNLEFIANLFEAIPSAVYFKDVDGKYLGCNAVYEHVTGIRRENLIGKTAFDVWPADLAQIYHDTDQEIIKEGSSRMFEGKALMANGEIHHTIFAKNVIRDDQGRIIGLVGVTTDISQQVLQQQELEQWKQYFELITEASGEIVYNRKVKSGEVLWSGSVPRVLGYSKDEMSGGFGQWKNLIHPKDIESVLSLMEKAESNAAPFMMEYRFQKKDGSYILVRDKGLPVKDVLGEIESYVGMMMDYTEKHHAEHLLRLQHRIGLQLSLAKSVQEVVNMVFDVVRHIEGIDCGGCYLVDKTTQKLTLAGHFGLSDNFIKNAENYQFTPEQAELIAKGVAIHGSFEQVQSHLDAIALAEGLGALSVIPVMNEGELIAVLNLASHFSEEISKESCLILEAIGAQVGGTMARLFSEQELIITKEKAEESSRLKSSLLSNMSHELRTPLNGIMGFAEILRDSLKDEDDKMMAQTIINSGNRLMSTLNSIMHLSQIESDRTLIKPDLVDIAYLVRELLPKYSEIAAKKSIRLIDALEPSVKIEVDKEVFAVIVQHLLDNAFKYTHAGSVLVSAKPVMKNGEHKACFAVTDTGIGIPEDKHEFIFEAFRQISEGFGRSYEGTGLGLTLCRKYINLMNGSIHVESKLGIGSTFSVFLPISKETQEVAPAESKPFVLEPRFNAAIRLKNGHRPKVLIIEDNEINSELISLYLAETCDTDVAPDGVTGLKMAFLQHYDLVLLDINLGPLMDGISVAREIRATQGYEHTPIIAVTGYTAVQEKNYFLNNGFSHYLAKPFDREGLVSIVQEGISII